MKLGKLNFYLLLIIIFSFIFNLKIHANDNYPFADKHQEQQFRYLLTQVRCVVCQNQDLSDSNASIAEDLRQQIYSQIQEGKTSQQILDYLASRYGDFVLFKPPLKNSTLILWFAPIIFILIGIIIFITSFKQVLRKKSI